MLPEGGLSLEPVSGRFIYDLGEGESKTLDYHIGGINLQDPSHGFLYQMWRGRVINADTDRSKIILDARYTPEFTLIEHPFITEFNFSFDLSMRAMAVFIALEEEQIGAQTKIMENCYLYWFDNTLRRYDLVFLGNNIKTPKMIIDDPREKESQYFSKSDTCLFYWRSGNLYVKYLRDRFTEEHLIKRNVPYIERVGMNEFYRIQWDLIREVDTCEKRRNKNDCKNKEPSP